MKEKTKPAAPAKQGEIENTLLTANRQRKTAAWSRLLAKSLAGTAEIKCKLDKLNR